MLERITGGPWHWLPPAACYRLPQIGVPMAITSIEAAATAAMTRTHITHRRVYDDCSNLILDTRRHDYAFLSPPFPEWYDESIVMHSRRNVERAHCLGIVDAAGNPILDSIRRRAQLNRPTHDLQREILCSITPDMYDAQFLRVLRQRIMRWISLHHDGGFEHRVHAAAEVFMKHCKGLRAWAPPCVTLSIIKGVMNGWDTDKRYQLPPRPCVLHEDCIGDDSLEHYCKCPYAVEQFFLENVQSAPPWNGLDFFLLRDTSGQHIDRMAVHHFITLGLVNRLRWEGQRAGGERLHHMYRERGRTLRIRFPRLAAHLNT